MQQQFETLADHVTSKAQGDEIILLSFAGEESDFVRFNHAKIRQSGSVLQSTLTLRLIVNQTQSLLQIPVTGVRDVDAQSCDQGLSLLREQCQALETDPYIAFNETVSSSNADHCTQLPNGEDLAGVICEHADGHDFVGFAASGDVFSGFANSLGQRNWFSRSSFSIDWSLYHSADKAVKSAYAGFEWDEAAFEKQLSSSTQQLEIIKRPPKTLNPGLYDVYLAPRALDDIVSLLSWGGFGLRAHRTDATPLINLINGKAALSHQLSMTENVADGASPNFDALGYVRPKRVPLIEAGAYAQTLNSPRSAKEFDEQPNGANEGETPTSVDVAAGDLPQDRVLEQLGTGLYINNLWYLNYSDRNTCRMTGMTRFATLWVEDGVPIAPVNVMRFDETVYRMLGTNLEALTQEREFILAADTYESRSTSSKRLPGALVRDFALTL